MKGIDDLKRKQLTELSILNGTYRPSSLSSSVFSKQSPVSTHRGIQVPSTPTSHFVYASPSPMAYVPPHRRLSQQMQTMPSHGYPLSPFYHNPPHVMESPEFVDPGIEEVVSALVTLLCLHCFTIMF